jgi:purine-cytosine permease-like protein
MFLYVYIGLLVPVVTIQSLGAAVVVAVPGVPEWAEGYEGGNIGGLLEAMLHPVGGFGKFLTVLLSLSAAGNIAGTLYSVSINFQVFVPRLVAVPRYLLSILATGM